MQVILLFVLAPYIKAYLLQGKKCIAKKKTKTARKTLDPLYSQHIEFPQNYNGKILQVSLVVQFDASLSAFLLHEGNTSI